LNAKGFLSCSQSSLLHLLSKETLSIKSELQLITAATRWCQHQNSGVSLDCERAQQLLGPCLQQLRMLSLSAGEFSQHVVPSGLLSNDDALATLMNISAPKNSPLPDIVCANRTRRTMTVGNTFSVPSPTPSKPPAPSKGSEKDCEPTPNASKPLFDPQMTGIPNNYFPGHNFQAPGGFHHFPGAPHYNNAPGGPPMFFPGPRPNAPGHGPRHFPQNNVNVFNKLDSEKPFKPNNKGGPKNSPFMKAQAKPKPKPKQKQKPEDGEDK
jgi:hypothetical protein